MRKLLIAGVLAAFAGLMGLGLASASFEPNAIGFAKDAALESYAALSSHSNSAGSALAVITDRGTLSSTLPMTGPVKVIMAITNFFSSSVTATQVISMHNAGWGFGEIFMMYRYAQESGKTASDIEAMRDAGMGWGQIAKELDLAPGNKGFNLGAAVSGRKVVSTTVESGFKPNKGKGNNPPGLAQGQEEGQNLMNGPGRGNGKGRGRGR